MKRHLPYKVPLIILLILFFCFCVDKARACESENDLSEISLKDYYLCIGGQNWCKRDRK